MIVGIALAWTVILVGAWLGWQLLRQNGRLLLRLEELEKRLDELEFGGADRPEGLPLGSDAPSFELPDLAGERESLTQFRGQSLLLIFFNPACGYCHDLAPKLAAAAAGFQPASEGGILPPRKPSRLGEATNNHDASALSDAGLEAPLTGRQGCPPLRLLILTTGDAERNREFFREHNLGCPVLLQNDGEVAKAYQTNGTPSGYLISADGKIASALAVGAEALLALAVSATKGQPLTPAFSPPDGEMEKETGEVDGRAARFSNRSLARSKIKRDGLKAGTRAPDFRLPRLDGRGDLGLSDLRGRRVLLVFSSPHCGPCNVLAPALEKFHRENRGKEGSPSPWPSPSGEGESSSAVEVVMISKGEPKENRTKIKEYGLTFPVVLQQQWEISRKYAMFATPVAYLVDEVGVIARDVAVGTDAILRLLAELNASFPLDRMVAGATRRPFEYP